MPDFTVQIQHSPIEDGDGWFAASEPFTVNAMDVVWAALKVFRERRLQRGRDRIAIGGRLFHPGGA